MTERARVANTGSRRAVRGWASRSLNQARAAHCALHDQTACAASTPKRCLLVHDRKSSLANFTGSSTARGCPPAIFVSAAFDPPQSTPLPVPCFLRAAHDQIDSVARRLEMRRAERKCCRGSISVGAISAPGSRSRSQSSPLSRAHDRFLPLPTSPSSKPSIG